MYYESLIAGTIPIVLESKYCYLLKYKYYNVPFIITKDYSDINEHTLNIIYKFYPKILTMENNTLIVNNIITYLDYKFYKFINIDYFYKNDLIELKFITNNSNTRRVPEYP